VETGCSSKKPTSLLLWNPSTTAAEKATVEPAEVGNQLVKSITAEVEKR